MSLTENQNSSGRIRKREKKEKRKLYMKNYRAKNSRTRQKAYRLQQMRQHASEIRRWSYYALHDLLLSATAEKPPNFRFGGINVLLFGDLMQLPPVRGHQVFQQPKHMKPATHLWRQFHLVELKQNMHQQGDTTFIDVHNDSKSWRIYVWAF
ncbi:ATP-dependent DNA helicase [Caerostris extrusa]|uniref:ATP-dependent DNA helicase n=1 Tax=Caerostris extrusa TaxID=172846 RepID=A0AAV4QMM4_CAEEX|nr:ATP-dependent DNA helicase [Caerostris extrusa]